MKRIYVCIGIVVLLLAAAFYSSFRVQQFAEDISDDIDTAMEDIRNSDRPVRGRHWPKEPSSATPCGRA